MSGFTKLVPEIVASSIWKESSDTRVVWITMIAMKDKDGFVRGDASAISRFANVSAKATAKALEIFQRPDPSSESTVDEGRRVRLVPGGWYIINHSKYRNGDRTEYMREYMRNYRETLSDVQRVNCVNANAMLTSASVSASVSGKKKEYPEDFVAFWSAYPLKVGKFKALKAWNSHKPPLDQCLKTIEAWMAHWKQQGRAYTPHAASWLNAGRWEDEAPAAPRRREVIL